MKENNFVEKLSPRMFWIAAESAGDSRKYTDETKPAGGPFDRTSICESNTGRVPFVKARVIRVPPRRRRMTLKTHHRKDSISFSFISKQITY